jgi:hypothetical protein
VCVCVCVCVCAGLAGVTAVSWVGGKWVVGKNENQIQINLFCANKCIHLLFAFCRVHLFTQFCLLSLRTINPHAFTQTVAGFGSLGYIDQLVYALLA